MMIVGALVIICVATSTKEGRAAAGEMLKPYGRIAGVIAAALWVLMMF